MRAALGLLLAIVTILAGCQTRPDEHSSFFRRTTWWERRMDRLATWDRRHGYPLTHLADGSKQLVTYSLIATASVAGLVLLILCSSEEQKFGEFSEFGYPANTPQPYRDPRLD